MNDKIFLYRKSCSIGKDDGAINLYPAFRRAGMSLSASTMLGFIWDCAKETGGLDAWLGITSGEMEQGTGLTIYEQQGARKQLRSLGFIEEKRTGPSAMLHFKINFQNLLLKLKENE